MQPSATGLIGKLATRTTGLIGKLATRTTGAREVTGVEFKFVYVYNPYDSRHDNTALLDKLGDPNYSIAMERGVIYAEYMVMDLTDDDYEVIYNTSLDPVQVSCMTSVAPTAKAYESSIKMVGFMTATTLGVNVDGVNMDLYYTPHGYISTYTPISNDMPIYPSSIEESMRMSSLCMFDKKEPALDHPLFHHHAFIECAVAAMRQGAKYDLLEKDRITYVVPTGSSDHEHIEDIRMISTAMIADGTVCLPRVRGDSRLKIFKEIANQWKFEVKTTHTGDNEAISIVNTDTEIPGHIWFEESAQRITMGKIPLYTANFGEVRTPMALARHKYIAVVSYLALCRKYPDLYTYINEVDASFDGSTIVPVCNRSQIKLFERLMQDYIDASPVFTEKEFDNLDNAILARWYFSNIGFETLLFEVNGRLFVVGLFDHPFPGTSDEDLVFDSLYEATKKVSKDVTPNNLFDVLKRDMDYLSFTGITAMGPIRGMVTIPPIAVMSVQVGSVFSSEFNDPVNEDISDLIRKKLGSLTSVGVHIGDRTEKLFVTSDISDELLFASSNLWSKGFFLNNWARQYYTDNGDISASFMVRLRELSTGIDDKSSEELSDYLIEMNRMS